MSDAAMEQDAREIRPFAVAIRPVFSRCIGPPKIARGTCILAGGMVKLLLWWSAGLGVLAWDSFALLAGVAMAGVTAVLAALTPATRAARLDANRVLRTDD